MTVYCTVVIALKDESELAKVNLHAGTCFGFQMQSYGLCHAPNERESLESGQGLSGNQRLSDGGRNTRTIRWAA